MLLIFVRSALEHCVIFSNVVVIITHPLLAATSRQCGKARLGAAPVRKGHMMRAERHAAHHSIHAGAAVLATRLKVFTMLVHSAIQLTWPTLSLSC